MQSSIQQRRKTNRRHQSLEVPILAATLPEHPLYQRQNGQHRHEPALSLKQSLSAINSPTEFPPLLPQDHSQPSGSLSVHIRLDTTVLGQSSDQQHFVQEQQQQRPTSAQPGYPLDFQSHLQQQLQGIRTAPSGFIPVTVSHSPHQQEALQKLQHHPEWYHSTYGHSRDSNVDATMPMSAFMQGAPMQPAMVQPMPVPPQTPILQGHARTAPNTPQTYAQAWPSPPPTTIKHERSQSLQLDVAPMGDSNIAAVTFNQQSNGFAHDWAAFTGDHGNASSTYSSSIVNPLSPCNQPNAVPMPTLFEETTPSQGQFGDSFILLEVTAGAQGFHDPDFDFGGPVALSPRQQLLNNLGPDVPASIVETGVATYEVQQYIGELSETDNKYPCLWEDCGRRFGRKENVRAHVQTHLGDRQFMCNICDKAFVRQHDLKRHIAIHSDDRPFVCQCGTGFARHDALTRHRQRGVCIGALPGSEKSEEEKPKRGRPKKKRPSMQSRVDKASKQRGKNKAKGAATANAEEPEVQVVYASSSSGASERSFPVTPPDTSDAFDADLFLNMANGEDVQFNNATSSCRDTPPTSPFSSSPTETVSSFDPTFLLNEPARKTIGISPAMLSTGSSPLVKANATAYSTHTPQSNHNIFDYSSPSNSNDASGSSIGGSSPADMVFFDSFDAAVSTQPDVGFDAFSPPGDSIGCSSIYNYTDSDADFMDEPLNDFAAHQDASMPENIMPNMDAANRMSLADLLDDWITAQ